MRKPPIGERISQSADIGTARAIVETWQRGQGHAMNHEAETFERYDSANYVNTIDDVGLYLEAPIDEGEDDPRGMAQALGTIARSKNFSAIARQAGMSREGLYKAFSPESNPTLATVIKVAHALGLRLRFEAIA